LLGRNGNPTNEKGTMEKKSTV